MSFGLKIQIGVRGGGKDGKDSESKTVAMLVPTSISKVQDRKLSRMNETFVPFCTKFKYLGSNITCDLDDTTEIERRLSHAQMAFNTLWKIFCSQCLRVDSGASCTRCAS
jgi:hypothetical protein